MVEDEARAASKLSKKSIISKKSVKSVASTMSQDSKRTSLADMSMNSVSRASFSTEDSEDDTTIHGSDNEGSVHSKAKSNVSVAKSVTGSGGSVHAMLENLAKSVSRNSSRPKDEELVGILATFFYKALNLSDL